MNSRLTVRQPVRLGAGIGVMLILFASEAAAMAPHVTREASVPTNGSELAEWPEVSSGAVQFSMKSGASVSGGVALSEDPGGALDLPKDPQEGVENPANSPRQVWVRFGSFGATLVLFGVVGFLLFVVPTTGELGKELAASLRMLGLLAASAQITGVMARLFAQTALLRSVFGEMAVWDVAVSSWGIRLLIQAVGGVLVGVAFLWGGRFQRSLAAMGALVLALAFPWIGHAADGGALQGIVDSVHVASSGVWIGGLGVLLALLAPLGGWRRSHERVAALLPRFARIAMIVGPLAVVTGALNAWLHAPALSSWLVEPYGQLLIAKIVLVGMILTLGAINHLKIAPLAGTDKAAPRLLRTGMVELSLAVGVVIVTAFLVATAMD